MRDVVYSSAFGHHCNIARMIMVGFRKSVLSSEAALRRRVRFIGASVFRSTCVRAKKPTEYHCDLGGRLGQGDLRSYNSRSAIPTPAMDSLADQGMRFTDMHSPSAVCTPTRYSLLTGRYAWRSRLKKGVLFDYDPMLIEEGRPTLPSLLKSVGYATYGVGKWHLGLGNASSTNYGSAIHPGPVDRGI